MQNKFTSLLLFLFIATGFSQSRADLMVATKKIYQANYNMGFDDIVALSYPKIVEIMGKETMLEKLDLRHQNEEFRLRLQLEIVPFQFGPIKKIEGKSFCVVTYRNPIRYFFENKLTPEMVIEKTAWLKEVNQTKDITFEPKRNSFNVKKISTFVAVADETTYTEWKFFNFDDANQKEIFETTFNETVKKELGL